MRVPLPFVLVVLSLSIALAPAHAGTPATTVPAPPSSVAPRAAAEVAPATRVESYGLSLGMADAAWLTVGLAGLYARSEPMLDASLIGYAVGAPLVHLCHGEGKHAIISFTTRVTLPTLLTLALLSGDTDEEEWGDAFGFVLGIGLGGSAAVMLDYVLLSKRTVRVAPRTWTPTLSADPRGVSLGVAGLF